MLIISKVIISEWLKSLLGALLVLFILLTVGDIVNGFLRNYEARRVFIEYALKMPNLMGKMIPISALLATLFCINKLKGKSELIAMLGAGFSAKRFYILFLGASFFVGLLQFINLGFIDPFANKIKRQEFEKSRRNESKYLARSNIGGSGYLWYKTGHYFASYLAYDAKNEVLKNVSLYVFDESSKGKEVIKAQTAKFSHDTLWILEDPFVVKGLETKEFPFVEREGRILVDLNEGPNSFRQFESDITTLNYFQLASFIKRLKGTEINTSEYQIMLYEKLSLSIICILFALFPAAGIFTPNARSSSFGKSVVFTLIFSIVFWMAHSSVIAFGSSGKLPPLAATMAIPIVFLIYIFFTYRRHTRL